MCSHPISILTHQLWCPLGRPSPVEFLSQPFSRGREFYNLSWVVTSWPPLDEVRLLWRRVQMNESYQTPGKWHDVILAPNPKTAAIGHVGTDGRHEASYMIRPLQPGAMYEAIVQAKNRYGWNEVSDLYKFYTRSSSGQYFHSLCSIMLSSLSVNCTPHTFTYLYTSACLFAIHQKLNILTTMLRGVICIYWGARVASVFQSYWSLILFV